ncbi:cell wall / vacuolar inhibitor of fructosidase 2-like [Macadamia integrifolia]|uniref:cell wall / vacuolar inhibitor of fructosidase 2-like n=1 Tax=Macadamia integrifolia TaxID=60698 RepID=UPI001C4E8A1D|nr:cell wall / vacuolar inhibitor of fructosidase 2-like [Macadamia integrifolia]
MASAPVVVPFSVLFFTLSLFFCDVSASVLKGNGDLIQQTCKKTDNYTLCMSLLQSDPHTELKSNLNGLLNIFIDISIKKATSNKLYIDRLLKAAKDEESKQCLDQCKISYVHGPFCNLKMYSRNEDYEQLCRFSLKVVDLIDPNHKSPLV